MPKAEKLERVGKLKERIEGSDALLLTEYRGLTVSDITELRRSLAEGGTGFAVVKNTLMQRAAVEASIDELELLIDGPTAVAFVAGDPVSAAKKVVDAAKKFPTLILKGGYMDGRVLSAAEARSLADLESREVMLSKVAGLLKGEMSRAAAVLVAAQSKFLSLLEAYKEKVPGQAPAAEEAGSESMPEPVPEAVPEAVPGAGNDPTDVTEAGAATDVVTEEPEQSEGSEGEE
jgi:large subunit ribosomal protein L10